MALQGRSGQVSHFTDDFTEAEQGADGAGIRVIVAWGSGGPSQTVWCNKLSRDQDSSSCREREAATESQAARQPSIMQQGLGFCLLQGPAGQGDGLQLPI